MGGKIALGEITARVQDRETSCSATNDEIHRGNFRIRACTTVVASIYLPLVAVFEEHEAGLALPRCVVAPDSVDLGRRGDAPAPRVHPAVALVRLERPGNATHVAHLQRQLPRRLDDLQNSVQGLQ